MSSLVREPSPLSALPARLPRPRALTHGRWAASRLDEGDLGPSMLEVVIWYPQDGDQDANELAAALGPAGGEATVMMDRHAVAALVPERAAALPRHGDAVELRGASHPASAFEGGGFFGARAVAIAGGVLVAVRTGG